MAWLYLIVAGICEWGWPVGLKLGWSDQGAHYRLDHLCDHVHGGQRCTAAPGSAHHPHGHRLCRVDGDRCRGDLFAWYPDIRRAGHLGAVLFRRADRGGNPRIESRFGPLSYSRDQTMALKALDNSPTVTGCRTRVAASSRTPSTIRQGRLRVAAPLARASGGRSPHITSTPLTDAHCDRLKMNGEQNLGCSSAPHRPPAQRYVNPLVMGLSGHGASGVGLPSHCVVSRL